jgi:hypothetical protein
LYLVLVSSSNLDFSQRVSQLALERCSSLNAPNSSQLTLTATKNNKVKKCVTLCEENGIAFNFSKLLYKNFVSKLNATVFIFKEKYEEN